MRRFATFAAAATLCVGTGHLARAEHANSSELRTKIESLTSLLDSHARRLYYDARDAAEADGGESELVAQAGELWRVARRLSNRAMAGGSAASLEREAVQLEEAFHNVEQQVGPPRRGQGPSPLRKRVERLEQLVHDAHHSVHELVELEAAARRAGHGTKGPRTPAYSGEANWKYRPPLIERRPVEYQPPPVRVGPDGLYFDGFRLVPFGR
jgi:hypothetical protein